MAIGPWVVPVISAVAGFLGDRSSASAQSDASSSQYEAAMANVEANERIAADNLAWERERFELLQMLSEELRAEDKMGGVDAYGNAAYWTDDRGYIQDPHPTVKRLMDADLRAQTLDKTVIDRHQRERESRLAGDQREEHLVALQNLSKYNRTDMVGAGELADLMNRQGMAGYNEAMDRQTGQAMTSFARQRNQPASQQWMSDRASATGRDFMDMRAANELAALTGADDINYNRLGNNADQYGYFRDKSVEPWNVFGRPASIPMNTPAQGSSGSAATSQLFSQRVPTLDYLQPNFADSMNILGQGASSANSWNALGGLVGALGSIWDTQSDPNRQVGSSGTYSGGIPTFDEAYPGYN
jgi:hypothetical protein